MILYLGRHGQSEANVLRIFSNGLNKHGLTDLGRQQAGELADRLYSRSITRIFSSPILRAIQTAEIISERIKVPFKVEPAVAEFSVGDWEGRGDDELWHDHDYLLNRWLIERDYAASNGGGENYRDIQKRFLPFIDSLVNDDTKRADTLIIGHGGTTLSMLPCLTRDISPEEVLHLKYRNTGLIVLEWLGNTFRYVGME